MSRDNEQSDDFRKFQYAVEEALKAGKIPIECLDEIELEDGYVFKTVVLHEV